MSKKYVPSGYQIINLEYPDIESGTPLEKTPETEDEKILYKILTEKKSNKPILINILCDSELFSQFAIRIDNMISVGDISEVNYSHVRIIGTDGKLNIVYKEV